MKMARNTLGIGWALVAIVLPSAPTASWAEPETAAQGGPLFVSTWPFGKLVNEVALKVLQEGGSALDAVEQGIWVMEEDENDSSIGIGGKPNAAGVVQLDAVIMWGPGQLTGSGAALEGILHPISVARRVMEKTPHVMLVGEGARQFALEQGFESVELLTERQRQAWVEWKKNMEIQKLSPDNHDSISLLALDRDGNIAAGSSTSGVAYKLPGRVGDSPIVGAGLYVDNEVGAAGATGLGENIMRYCGSFMIVEYMRQGLSPQEACEAAVKRIVRMEGRGPGIAINFVALDKRGRHGAAGTQRSFSYSATTESESKVVPSSIWNQVEEGGGQ